MVASVRGQQATPNDNNPKPAIRAMTSAAPEISVPNKNPAMLGAMINAKPVTASRVEAVASSTLVVIRDPNSTRLIFPVDSKHYASARWESEAGR